MSRLIRTFVAVLVDEELSRRVGAVQNRLKRLAPAFKWVQPRNFHVTLNFLGDVMETDMPVVCLAIRGAVAALKPFRLSVKGFGAFPSQYNPRVVWVGIETGKDALVELAHRTHIALSSVGLAGDDKPFKAHITIGRAREERVSIELMSALWTGEIEDIGSQMVYSVAVVKSDLTPAGPIYTAIEIVPIGAGCRF